ncbi:Transcriptional regulator, contains XRE-family HTH domain [Paracoccus isoporae]|uniref:Transcriptional regulator, contains XRE-family HTH domain n=1 Tax=Paracoccus isoporae TaxID=591205 RepID=A0A1G7FCB4_9RHOB|nr:XRE family transcriptional regulator [Paracoccus isoporae]SDE73579.1 Transcriptional regulator, contains XRE-family HTH domain [Paracoccus isoporae]
MPFRPPRIGPVIQTERKQRRLTLEQLAAQSGVSRSMLSQIERGETNPTFAVVWALTQALGINMADLLGEGAGPDDADGIEVVPAAHTPLIRSTDGSCELRILSSPRTAGATEWYELTIAPGGSLDSEAHAAGAVEHLTALTDGIRITSGDSRVSLKQGETARYAADVPHEIANLSDRPARGFLVVLLR